MGICSGFAIPVAQQFGAGKYSELRKYVFNGYVCSAVFAVVMTILSVVFCAPILRLLNTPDDIFMHAYNYIVIIVAGIPTVFLYNIVSGIIRSLGDSKTPVYFLVLSSVINIALDFILILYVKMGVAGAGVATVVSQLIAGVGCTIYMYKKFDILKGTKQEKVISKKHISNLCFIGVPMGLQYSITAIGSTILQAAVNGLGSSYVAAMTAGSKMFNFTCCPFDALGSTMATYGGQNVGAGKIDRLGKGIKAAMLIGAVYSVVALVVLYFSADYIALLFVDAGETAIIELTRRFIMASALFYIPLTGVNVYRFCIQCRFSRRAAAPFPISRRIFQRPPRRVVQRKSSLTVRPQSMTHTRRGRQHGCPVTRRSSGILHPVCSFLRKNALRRSCTSISTVRKRPPTNWMQRRQRSPRNGCCARSVSLMKPAAQPRPNCALIPWISPRPS